jgi:hypothetical protein
MVIINEDLRQNNLPLKQKLNIYYIFSIIIAILVAGTSFLGIFYSSVVFPTAELRQGFMVTDVINLILIIPLLILTMCLTLYEKMIGLLFWPGVIMMIIYHYTAYVFGTPISWISLLYFTILVISVYVLIGLFVSIDGEQVRNNLSGLVFEKLSGWILVIFGFFILLRFYCVFANSFFNQEIISVSESSTAIADFFLCPTWIICGILLIKKKALGYVGAAGLLFKLCMLFIGLLAYFIITPMLTEASFKTVDFIVIFILTIIFNIPFVLFVKGILKRKGNIQNNN